MPRLPTAAPWRSLTLHRSDSLTRTRTPSRMLIRIRILAERMAERMAELQTLGRTRLRRCRQ